MTQVVNVITSCDVDDAGDARTIKFALDGKNYEIDACDPCYEQMKARLAPYTDRARQVASPPARNGNSKTRSMMTRRERAAIREWAFGPDGQAALTRNRVQISDRGRIPSAVIDLYNAR